MKGYSKKGISSCVPFCLWSYVNFIRLLEWKWDFSWNWRITQYCHDMKWTYTLSRNNLGKEKLKLKNHTIGHRQKKKLPRFVLLLLWPSEVRRKRKGDSGRTGPALFAGSNNQSWVNFFFCRCPIEMSRYLHFTLPKFEHFITSLYL